MPRNSEAAATAPAATTWPVWARVAVSLLLLWHVAATLVYEFNEEPYSGLEQAVAAKFFPYLGLINEWQRHQYYAPEPPDTPIVLATIQFADGRPEKEVRLPDPGLVPRLRLQRRLAFAFNVHAEAQKAAPHLRFRAASYARYLCRQNPGASLITIYTQWHLIPRPEEVRRALGRGETLDLDGRRYYSAKFVAGDYPCP